MNIFVASWFFPPATSSEGIVTYKLLRNSKHQYDVFSSTSKQWGYKFSMQCMDEKNIHCEALETDSIDEWVEGAVARFDELYPERKYSCIMTRSTPPESILVGKRIKEKYPNIKWIASLADPVANNPYELKAYVDECNTLTAEEKRAFRSALRSSDEKLLKNWEKRPEHGVRLLCKLKRWENFALNDADMIISPTGRQLRYIYDDQRWAPKFCPISHSFDASFYKKERNVHKEKTIFSFIGYSDTTRSLEPIVQAVHLLKENGSPFLEELEIRFIGNNPRFIYDMVLNYYLDDVIKFYPAVDYYKSLEMMQEADWLIHVDAYFPELTPGGSIFFAGKLADYMGAGRPILALTGQGSPADEIISKAGGISVLPWEINKIATAIESILTEKRKLELNSQYIEQFSATRVATRFDFFVEKLCGITWKLRNNTWPINVCSNKEKLVTICVPGYNVERYLERCLRTLLDHEYVADIEILVVDDGSKDHTAEIAQIFEKHYPGIVRVIRKQNGGHGSTINRAVQEGCGVYFMVVDGDDWIDSNQFSKLLKDIKEQKITSDIVSSNYHEVNMESGKLTEWKQQTDVTYFEETSFEKIDFEHTYFTLASSLIKLSILKKVNKPLQEHTFYVDVEYILFPVPYLKTVTFVDYYIYKYCRGNAEQSVHIPTMVKRYDHHERVMKRVLEYGKTTEMTTAQRAYYTSVLKRLLYTHYALFMIYDTDKKHGYAIGKDFDAFLHQENPALAKWIAKEMPLVSVARKYSFDYDKVEKSLRWNYIQKKKRIKEKIKNFVKNSRLFRKVFYNSFTIKIGKHTFFTQGRGYDLKQKLKKMCGL